MHQIAERAVDQSLPLEPRQAIKGRAFNLDAEMTFTRSVVASVTMMLGAVIADNQARRGEGGK